jgi:hypothetical protein
MAEMTCELAPASWSEKACPRSSSTMAEAADAVSMSAVNSGRLM